MMVKICKTWWATRKRVVKQVVVYVYVYVCVFSKEKKVCGGGGGGGGGHTKKSKIKHGKMKKYGSISNQKEMSNVYQRVISVYSIRRELTNRREV